MNVVWCMLHQQCGELQQADSQRIQQVSLLLRVQYLGEAFRDAGLKIVKDIFFCPQHSTLTVGLLLISNNESTIHFETFFSYIKQMPEFCCCKCDS